MNVILMRRYSRIWCLGLLSLLVLNTSNAQNSKDALDEAIEKYRKGVLVIEAPPDTEVTVEQQRHEFWFGAALSNQAQ